ncbi:hypothetical protein [Streptomyces fulvorobeus]|uniref:Uncharacterized protein n=1 Tax=Streptomyces fulvorobeus TaxID=284028 RepID=A0A7J0CBX4_9ACTN|nr:hypothetical protein [Streptomyces fulvorobeus]NYE43442.1 hypothetical protein [Streptomyces fulvorobeus]GFM99908.1 hypothetical protein Sfulv_47190 [Streptomyces fulvorobeus]
MEQRIDSKTQPEFAAGTDPAYIPGLTAPVTARTEEDVEPADSLAEGDAVPEPAADPAATAAAKAVEPEAEPAAEAGPDADEGPVFEVSDRRGSIRVDRAGVLFRLDDQEADFTWDEIGAVEVRTARLGRRFTVTVHVSSRRWFNAEVEAASRSELKEWPARLDAVLDTYFEES